MLGPALPAPRRRIVRELPALKRRARFRPSPCLVVTRPTARVTSPPPSSSVDLAGAAPEGPPGPARLTCGRRSTSDGALSYNPWRTRSLRCRVMPSSIEAVRTARVHLMRSTSTLSPLPAGDASFASCLVFAPRSIPPLPSLFISVSAHPPDRVVDGILIYLESRHGCCGRNRFLGQLTRLGSRRLCRA